MIWALGSDDHNGRSCGMGEYPLLTTISNCLKKRSNKLTSQLSTPSDSVPSLSTVEVVTVSTRPSPPAPMESGVALPLTTCGEGNSELYDLV